MMHSVATMCSTVQSEAAKLVVCMDCVFYWDMLPSMLLIKSRAQALICPARQRELVKALWSMQPVPEPDHRL